jgi:hypothetical protein
MVACKESRDVADCATVASARAKSSPELLADSSGLRRLAGLALGCSGGEADTLDLVSMVRDSAGVVVTFGARGPYVGGGGVVRIGWDSTICVVELRQ